MQKNNNKNENEEKTVLLDEEEKTVLLSEEEAVGLTEDTADSKPDDDQNMRAVRNDHVRCISCMNVLPSGKYTCPVCGFDISGYSPQFNHLPPGSVLDGRYTVGKVLGEGGFGITYIGFDETLDVRVAIKEYYPTSLVFRDTSGAGGNTVVPYDNSKELYEKFRNRFNDEARILARIKDVEGIVRVQNTFCENGTAYIVMDYVDGRNLKQYAKDNGGKIDTAEALKLLYPVAHALSDLHKNSVIHRDISPDNIMVTKEGKVILIDLGSSRESDGEYQNTTLQIKKGYAPIEQYQSSAKTGRYTDLYSFCAAFYRIITGVTPTESMDRLGGEVLKRPSELGVKIDRETEDALMKGLSIKAEDRFQSMDELIDVFYYKKSFEKKENGTKPDISVKKKNKIPLIIISAAVLAGIVTFLLVFLLNQNKVSEVGSHIADNSAVSAQDADDKDAVSETAADNTDIIIDPVSERIKSAEPAQMKYIDCRIDRSGQSESFNYSIPREGRYRVEVTNMPEAMSVDVSFYDSKGEVVGEEKGCKNGQGVTVKYLDPKNTYTIQVKQNSGTGSFRLAVWEQKPTKDVTELTRIDESVEYTDQRNLYNFEVPLDGRYRFELSGLESDTETDMLIFNDPGDKISEKIGCGNGEGLTLDNVKAGEIYEVQVRQKNGFSGYSLNIGQQKETVNISNNSNILDNFQYSDQRNIYSFNASSTGSVTFTLSEMDADMSADIFIKDDKGNTMASAAGCSKGEAVTMNNISAGTHYFVQVIQKNGVGDYTLTVN